MQGEIRYDPCDGSRSVNLPPQDKRYLRRNDISQGASGNAGHRPHQHHDERWALCCFRDLSARDRKKRQSQSISYQEQGVWRWPYPDVCDRGEGGYDDDGQVPAIGDPENRVAIQQEIAKSASTNSGDRCDNDDAEEV